VVNIVGDRKTNFLAGSLVLIPAPLPYLARLLPLPDQPPDLRERLDLDAVRVVDGLLA